MRIPVVYLAVAIAAFVVAACDEQNASTSRLREAGARVDGPAEVNPNVRDASLASGVHASSSPFDGGSLELCDAASFPRVKLTAGAPPLACMAPCVWDLIKNCLPQGVCGLQNGWRREPDPFSGFAGHYGYKVYVENRLCHGFGYGSVPPFNSFPQWEYTDAAGKVVAQGFGENGANGTTRFNVVCGSVCEFDASTGAFFAPCDGGAGAAHGTGSCPPGQGGICASLSMAAYTVDTTRPECGPWRELD